MSELKPCPFCGSKAKYYIDDMDYSHHEVACSNTECTYLISEKKTKEAAYAAWNQRQDGWISVWKEEPPLEKEVLVKYESGIVTTGWRRQFRPDDILYCLGTKEGNWDIEINNELGGIVIEWMPIPS